MLLRWVALRLTQPTNIIAHFLQNNALSYCAGCPRFIQTKAVLYSELLAAALRYRYATLKAFTSSTDIILRGAGCGVIFFILFFILPTL